MAGIPAVLTQEIQRDSNGNVVSAILGIHLVEIEQLANLDVLFVQANALGPDSMTWLLHTLLLL